MGSTSEIITSITTHCMPLPHPPPAITAKHNDIATPADAAQGAADALVAAGVTSIMNFAPIVLSVPDEVDLRSVDLAAELQILGFHLHRARFRDDADET